jgi:hypothetical protein
MTDDSLLVLGLSKWRFPSHSSLPTIHDPLHSSHSPLPWRTAAVVGQGRNILNTLYGDTRGLQSRDGALAAAAGPFNADLHLFDAELRGFFGGLLRRALSREGRALAAALETAGSGTRPTERITLGIGDGHRCVVKCRLDMRHAQRHVAANLTSFCLSHCVSNAPLAVDAEDGLPRPSPRYFKSFTPFLPATVFFGPFRVRALVLVR